MAYFGNSPFAQNANEVVLCFLSNYIGAVKDCVAEVVAMRY